MKKLLIFALFLISYSFANATHIMGGEITYTLLDSNTRLYKLRLVIYRDCAGSNNTLNGGTLQVSVRNLCTNGVVNVNVTKVSGGANGVDKTALCSGATSNCSGGSIQGLSQYVFEGNYNFPTTCNEYLMFYQLQARNSAINNVVLNGNFTWFYTDSYIKFSQYNYNSSSRNDNLLLSANFCLNNNNRFSFYSPDVNNDSIVYELIRPRQQNGTPMNYTGSPLPDSSHPTFDCGYNFDTKTGVYKFRPNVVQNALVACKIKEYKNGVLVGYVVREAQFVVSNAGGCGDISLNSIISNYCTTKKDSSIKIDAYGCYVDTFKSYDLVFCEGTLINLNIKYLNKNKVITNLNAYTGYGTMTDLDSLKNDSIRDFKFIWNNPIFGVHNITLDVNNCPTTGGGLKYTNSVTNVIRVLRSPKLSKDTIFYCLAGGAVDLSVNNLDSGVTFAWNHKSGFSYTSSDTTKIKVALTKDTTYIIRYKYYGDTCASCNNFDTLVVKYVPDFTYTTSSKNTNICISDNQQLTVTPDGSFPPYTYKWSPYGKLFHPITNATLDSASAALINNPIADPPAGTHKFNVEIRANSGCTLKDTFTVKVSDSIPYISGLANRYEFCNCDTTRLNVVPGYGDCGVPPSPFTGTYSTYTMGAGAINSPSTVNGYPAIFGNFQGPSVKHRILYKNSELAALGLTNKNIKDIAFLPNTIPGTNIYKNIKIYMGCTTADTIAANVTTTLVATKDSLFITPVWQTFALNGNGYNISNNDNLIVEFCFTQTAPPASTSGWANSTMKCDVTSFNSVAYVYGTGICSSTAWNGISNIRPQTRFSAGGLPTFTPTSYLWSPSAGLSATGIINPIASVCTPTDYVIKASLGVCSYSDTLHLHADSALRVTCRADTFICSNLKVQLSATYTGTPVPGKSFSFLWKSLSADTSLRDTTIINPIVQPNKTMTYVLAMYGGSCVKYDTVVITRATELSLNMTKSDPTCTIANGRAKASPINGNAPYTYIWNNAATTDSIINLVGGKYKVTVTGADGCIGNDSITLNTVIKNPILSFNKSNVKCFNEANGGIRVKTTIANAGPFSYTWIPSQVNKDTISNLTPQWYKVTVYDTATSCSSTDSIQITQPNKLLVNADSTDVSCNGGSNGTLSSIVSGGTTAYAYQWSDGSIGNNPSAISKSAGTYKLTVTDANGCKDSSTTIINQPSPLTSTKTQRNISCFNGSNGMARVTPSGGTGPYTYLWYKINPIFPLLGLPINLDSITNLLVGTYYCAILDAKGCPRNDTFIITQPTDISGSISVIKNSTCAGFNNGIAKVTASGGTGAFTYIWSSGTSFNVDTAFGLAKGANTVTVRDANLCQKTYNFNISEPNPIVTQDITINQVSCFGGNNGSGWINIASGGTAPFNFTWSPAKPNNDSIFNLTAGTYFVTVSDAAGALCFKRDTLTITEPAKLVASVSNLSMVTCFGLSNGRATASAIGGTIPYTYLWDNAVTSALDTTLNASNHRVIITDAKGCKDTTYALITQPFVLDVSLVSSSPTKCYGSKDGKAIAATTGGTYPYVYNWLPSSSETDSIVDTLFAGIHKVIVKDAKGCKDTLSGIVTSQPDSLKLTLSQTAANCYDSLSGRAKVSVTGGTGAYTYLWNTGEVIDSIANKHAGNYSVTVRDVNLCTKIGNINITQPVAYAGTKTIDSVTCNGLATGKAKIVVSGNTPNYAYLWSDASTKDSITGKIAGVYYLTTTDSKGCKKLDTFDIKQPLTLISNITAKTNATCFGQFNGTASATTNGGNPPYSYAWSGGGSTTNTKLTLGVGFNTVTVTDLKGCSDTAGVLITQPTKLTISFVDTQGVNCWYDTTGMAIVAATGGIYPYTYNWGASSSQTDSIADNLKFGTHKCIVIDQNGCRDSLTNIYIASPPPIVFSFALTHITCHDSATGKAVLTATGGSGTKTYLWSTGATINTITNKVAGSYSVTVTDQFNCKRDSTIALNQPSIFKDSVVIDSAICFGTATGKARVFITGNNPPYTYLWNEGTTTDSITEKNAGLYTLTTFDSKGCTKKQDVFIPQRDLFEAIVTTYTDVRCFKDTNGTAIVTVTGGKLPYKYAWGNGDTTTTTLKLNAGFHIVTCTDALNCSDTAGIFINQPAKLTAILSDTDAVKCWGDTNGLATIIVSGGNYPYTYNWGSSTSQTDSVVTNLSKGIHRVTVTDFKNCLDTVKNISITSPDTIKITFTMSPALCFGGSTGSAKAFASQGYGPYSYSWSTGGVEDTILNKPLGTYTVTVTDFNNCKNNKAVSISQPPKLISFNKKQDSVICFGESNGAAHIQIQGGIRPYSFSWSSTPVQTDSNAINLPAGDFVITTTDSNLCQRLDTISVKEPANLNSTVTIDSVVSCFGFNDAIVTINATGGNGGNLYNIGNGNRVNNKFTGLDSGVYFVTTKDMKGCEVITKFTITEPDKITSDIASINASCLENSNGKAFISNITGGNGGYTYLWSNGQTTDTASGLLALKKYFVTIKDFKNCIGRDTVFVDTNYVLRFSTISDSALCNGSKSGSSEVVHINGLAPYAYLWSSIPAQTTQKATSLNAGFYKVTVTDNNNCTASQNAFIAQPKSIKINIIDYQPYCTKDTNGSLKANVSGGTGPYNYLWNSNPPQNTDSAFGLSAGNYSVTVTDLKGCVDSMTIKLNAPPQLLFVDLIKSKNLSCNGSNDGELEVKGRGGFTPYKYQWDNPTQDTVPKIVQLEPGKKYKVTIIDNKGCTDTASYSLEQPDSLIFDHFIFTHVTCPEAKDGSMKILMKGGTVSNANPYQFSLDSIFWQDNRLFTKLQGGKYNLFVKDANGCKNKTNFEIEEPEKFSFSLQPSDTIIALGQSVVINTIINSNNPIPSTKFKYFWSPSTGLDCIECKSPTATPFQTQSYQLLLTYNDNCTFTKDALVVVENKFVTFIPSAFSPNKIGPAENEVFNVFGEGIIDLDMTIFNRWGEKVYESHGMNMGWDGTYKGSDAQEGVYTYSINVTYLGGGKKLFSGSVTLLR